MANNKKPFSIVPGELTKESLATQLDGAALTKLPTNYQEHLDKAGLVVVWAYDTLDHNECVFITGSIDEDITLTSDPKLFIYQDIMGQCIFGDQEEYGKDMGEELPENQPFIERKYVNFDSVKGVYEMTASFPFAPFTIMKNQLPYCVGLVFNRSDLDAQLALVSA